MNNNEWLKSEIARLELALQWQKERAERAEDQACRAEATLAEMEREVALLREKIKC